MVGNYARSLDGASRMKNNLTITPEMLKAAQAIIIKKKPFPVNYQKVELERARVVVNSAVNRFLYEQDYE